MRARLIPPEGAPKRKALAPRTHTGEVIRRGLAGADPTEAIPKNPRIRDRLIPILFYGRISPELREAPLRNP